MTDRYDEAVAHVRLTKTASVAALQAYGFTYTQAANYIARMEKNGVVTAPLATGKRKVIKPKPNYSAADYMGSG